MTTRFRGVKYKVKVKRLKGNCGGYATDPQGRKPQIVIDRGSVCLEVLVHEALHACYWDLDENAVFEAGRDIAKFLEKMGVTVETKCRQ